MPTKLPIVWNSSKFQLRLQPSFSFFQVKFAAFLSLKTKNPIYTEDVSFAVAQKREALHVSVTLK